MPSASFISSKKSPEVVEMYFERMHILSTFAADF
jgi:hypothetical protein